jgi:hypothetical protein
VLMTKVDAVRHLPMNHQPAIVNPRSDDQRLSLTCEAVRLAFFLAALFSCRRLCAGLGLFLSG